MENGKQKRIGVKFCGSCNPVWDTKGFFEELKKQPDMVFVPYTEPPYELLLVIHGCKKSCTAIPEFKGDIAMIDDEFITDCNSTKYLYGGSGFKLLTEKLRRHINTKER